MHFPRRSFVLGSACATLAWTGSPFVRAADPYPVKQVRFVVPYPPGGPTDLLARMIQPPLSEKLGANVVIDNRPGAGGNVGTDFVAKSPPDGSTILLASPGPMSVNATLYKSLPYDPLKDLSAVIQISAFPLVLEVNPNVPTRTVAEFIAYAKARSTELSFASAGNGTPQHLVGELFNRAVGTRMQHVPYRGAGPALNDLLGGQVPIMFDILGSSIGHIRGGKLRPLAVTTLKRSPQLPDIPTLAESGLPGFEFSAWHGIAVTSRMPRPLQQRLNAALNEIFIEPKFRAQIEELGTPVIGGPPERFQSLIVSETERLGQIVKASGASVD